MSKPFKLRGHELPGPNQRDPSPMKNRSDALPKGSGNRIEGFNTGASDPRAPGGVESFDFYDRLHDEIFGDMYAAGGGPILQESPNQLQEGGPRDQVVSVATDASGNPIGETAETTKKKVDVEVTVNGNPV